MVTPSSLAARYIFFGRISDPPLGRWRHRDLGCWRVGPAAMMPRVDCPMCGVVVASAPGGAEPGGRFTRAVRTRGSRRSTTGSRSPSAWPTASTTSTTSSPWSCSDAADSTYDYHNPQSNPRKQQKPHINTGNGRSARTNGSGPSSTRTSCTGTPSDARYGSGDAPRRSSGVRPPWPETVS